MKQGFDQLLVDQILQRPRLRIQRGLHLGDFVLAVALRPKAVPPGLQLLRVKSGQLFRFRGFFLFCRFRFPGFLRLRDPDRGQGEDRQAFRFKGNQSAFHGSGNFCPAFRIQLEKPHQIPFFFQSGHVKGNLHRACRHDLVPRRIRKAKLQQFFNPDLGLFCLFCFLFGLFCFSRRLFISFGGSLFFRRCRFFGNGRFLSFGLRRAFLLRCRGFRFLRAFFRQAQGLPHPAQIRAILIRQTLRQERHFRGKLRIRGDHRGHPDLSRLRREGPFLCRLRLRDHFLRIHFLRIQALRVFVRLAGLRSLQPVVDLIRFRLRQRVRIAFFSIFPGRIFLPGFFSLRGFIRESRFVRKVPRISVRCGVCVLTSVPGILRLLIFLCHVRDAMVFPDLGGRGVFRVLRGSGIFPVLGGRGIFIVLRGGGIFPVLGGRGAFPIPRGGGVCPVPGGCGIFFRGSGFTGSFRVVLLPGCRRLPCLLLGLFGSGVFVLRLCGHKCRSDLVLAGLVLFQGLKGHQPGSAGQGHHDARVPSLPLPGLLQRDLPGLSALLGRKGDLQIHAFGRQTDFPGILQGQPNPHEGLVRLEFSLEETLLLDGSVHRNRIGGLFPLICSRRLRLLRRSSGLFCGHRCRDLGRRFRGRLRRSLGRRFRGCLRQGLGGRFRGRRCRSLGGRFRGRRCRSLSGRRCRSLSGRCRRGCGGRCRRSLGGRCRRSLSGRCRRGCGGCLRGRLRRGGNLRILGRLHHHRGVIRIENVPLLRQ